MMLQKVFEKKNDLDVIEELSQSLAGEAEEYLKKYQSNVTDVPPNLEENMSRIIVKIFTSMPTRSVCVCV
jgi:hypothetical protein